MVKIKKIKIFGFKNSISTAEVSFPDNNFSIIYGDNGCGKTTFLKIIQAVLSKDDKSLISEEVKKIQISFSHVENIKHVENIEIVLNEEQTFPDEKIKNEFRLKDGTSKYYITENNLFESTPYFDWSEFDASPLANTKSISLGVERGYPSLRINTSKNQILKLLNSRRTLRNNFKGEYEVIAFAEELSFFLSKNRTESSKNMLRNSRIDHLFLKDINMDNVGEVLHSKYRMIRRFTAQRIQAALFDTLALVIENKKTPKLSTNKIKNFNKTIFLNKDLIIEALDDNQQNRLKDKIIIALRDVNSEEDVEEIRKNEILSQLLQNMALALKDSESELLAVNTIIDKFDSYTTIGKRLNINMDTIEIITQFGTHTLDELSSGERHILTLLTLLLDQGRGRDFIIIDEPEISLNSAWQEILLETLTEILPESQIIVASHSPIIAKSINNLAKLKVGISND